MGVIFTLFSVLRKPSFEGRALRIPAGAGTIVVEEERVLRPPEEVGTCCIPAEAHYVGTSKPHPRHITVKYCISQPGQQTPVLFRRIIRKSALEEYWHFNKDGQRFR